jgi:nitroreductase
MISTSKLKKAISKMSTENTRQPAYPVSPMFIERWSPRSFIPQSMPHDDLMTMLEAARYAPSASNRQPWRFIYAHRNTAEWEKILPVLFDSNAVWAKNASALVLVFSQHTIKSHDTGEERPFRSHAFDAGAAWVALALQAHLLGYSAHAMGGIHHDKAMEIFAVPDAFRPEVAIAIGKLGDRSTLPESLQTREMPSDRKPLEEIAGNGTFIA